MIYDIKRTTIKRHVPDSLLILVVDSRLFLLLLLFLLFLGGMVYNTGVNNVECKIIQLQKYCKVYLVSTA